jgi:uncharacterized protein (TIGR03083 family)
MTDPSWAGQTYAGLADLLDTAPETLWDAPSLCENWRVRHVVAHVTMPVHLTPESFGAEMAAAGSDFTVLSNTVAARDAELPRADLLAALRSDTLRAWQPPGGGAAAAVSHAVIHAFDITVALDRPAVAPAGAVVAVLDALTAGGGATFGVDLVGRRLETTDGGWSWGDGEVLRADGGRLVALLAGRTLPDGRTLRHTAA